MDRPTLVLSVGVAAAVATWGNVEWTFPYCNDLSDGPATAIFGTPLPYMRRSVAFSGAMEVAPLVLAANCVLLLLAIYPVLAAARRRIEGARISRGLRRAALWIGIVACTAAAGWQALGAIFAIPMWWISHEHDSYFEFRPIAIVADTHFDCTPSEYWFSERQRALEERRGDRGGAE